MRERRKAIRFKAAFDVKYTSRGIIELGSKTKSKDISISGIRIPINRLIKQGTKLIMEIRPPRVTKPIVTHGKVVWVRQFENNPHEDLDAGIKFTRIDIDQHNNLLTSLKGKDRK